MRVFAGDLEGGGHTLTIRSEGPAAPLFERLRGNVSNLSVVFEGDAAGTTFALDAAHTGAPTWLSGLSVTVKGSVVYADHDYLDYYASLLQGQNYGNWYLSYGGQPVHLGHRLRMVSVGRFGQRGIGRGAGKHRRGRPG